MVCLGRWTVEELRSVIVLLKRPEFNPAEIDDDLHKRIAIPSTCEGIAFTIRTLRFMTEGYLQDMTLI